MNMKKMAVTATMAGALGGFAALGLGAGLAPADPKFPKPPVPPIPAPPIPNVEVPRVEVPPFEVPRGPDVNVPPGQLPDLHLPPGQVPVAVDVKLPDLLPDVPDADDFFRLPHIPPGQLKNSAFINGVRNPFFGIPPGQLKKMRMVDNIENPFFDEAPGHWEVPEWGVRDMWPGVPEFDDFFGLPSEQLRPEQLLNSEIINGVRNPFFGIPPGQLKKMATVQGFENPFFDELPGHWAIP